MTVLDTLAPSGARHVGPARRVRGTIRVPGDKSISHRAALFNALADGEAIVRGFASGADCSSTLACLSDLGAAIERDGATVHIRGFGLEGGIKEPADVLDCGNSGTTMRLLAGALAGRGILVVLTGDASLRRRPMARVLEPLRAMGAHVHGRDRDRLPPLAIAPARLRGTEHHLAVASAQVKSALLLAGLSADGQTTVVQPAMSRDHTERMLRAMGADVTAEGNRVTVQPTRRLRAVDVAVPGDFSSAAFWLVLTCIHPDAEIRIEHVGLNPTRTGLLTILAAMGADVRAENVRDEAGEPVGDLVARSSRLRATTVAGALVPLAIDEVPLVALLGCFAEGETVVRDATELRVKESDRLLAVADGLTAFGADLDMTEDGWRIRPARLHAAAADARGDHRVAMLLALAGTVGQGADVSGADAVAISYPSFWDDLAEVTRG